MKPHSSTTTFILHGGESSRNTQANRDFFTRIIQTENKDRLNILCVYFARPTYRWEESFEEDCAIFHELHSRKKLNFTLATLDIKTFNQQILKSDILFMNGGLQGCLKETLEDLDSFRDSIRGKVVVGISAGANILSKYYWSSVAQSVREGIGILPIKLLCHYEVNDREEVKALEEYKEELPLYKLPEEHFEIIHLDHEWQTGFMCTWVYYTEI